MGCGEHRVAEAQSHARRRRPCVSAPMGQKGRLTCYNAPNRATPDQKEFPMDDTVRKITAEDINPRYNWGRALPAFGTMGVDFEQRVDYRRLHNYRLARARMAL